MRGARALMPQPTSGEPVKVIIATSGWSTSALPTVPPPPVTTLSQPAGSPHSSSRISASSSAVSGVCDAGFRTTGQPAAIAGRELVAHEVEREVERADRADDADRHPQREAELPDAGDVGVHRDHLAGERARLDRREREGSRRAGSLDARGLDRLGRFARDAPGELLVALTDPARRGVEDLGALPRGEQRLARERSFRGAHRGVDLVRSRLRDPPELRAVEGGADDDLLGRRDPLAADGGGCSSLIVAAPAWMVASLMPPWNHSARALRPRGGGETRRSPGLESTLEVRGVREADGLEARGGQARCVALVAEHDHGLLRARHLREAVGPGRIQAPFEDVAVDDERARDLPVGAALVDRTDVDQQRAAVARGGRRDGGHAPETGSGGFELLVDRHVLNDPRPVREGQPARCGPGAPRRRRRSSKRAAANTHGR